LHRHLNYLPGENMITLKIKLSGDGKSLYVEVPPDVMHALAPGKKRIKIKATFNGIPYRGLITPYGGVPVVGILKSIQQQLKKKAGDIITLTLEKDEEERIVEIPAELKTIFAKHKKEFAFYQSLSYTNRKEYVRWITDAKREETKQERLKLIVTKLAAGKKNPSEK